MFLFRILQPDTSWPNSWPLSIPLLMTMAPIQMAPKDFFFPKSPVSVKQILYIRNA